jgi:outer membrane receptor protein involved in Fe transport
MQRLLAAAIVLLSPILVFAQAEMQLTVHDPSGAGMQVSGKIENSRAGVSREFERTFETDAQGLYRVGSLPFGRYQVEVTRAGFVRQAVTIDLSSAVPVSRTITMRLEAAASQVDVVAATPLPGVDLPLDEIPAPVETATAADIEKTGELELSNYLNRRFNGVYLNEMQGNPFQVDLNYRGYTASPLLGTPQGISVYLDGVRQNQPFGDVVGWDLIPRNAIASATLMPGSDPLFGLNTLGGALSVQTKDGVANAGTSGQVGYGSNGRKSLEAEQGGGKAAGFNYFLAANIYHESGWRVDSASDVRQGFGKVGWRNDKTTANLTASYAYNSLNGLGLQDYRLLATDWRGVYTIPDHFYNRSPSVSFNLRRNISSAVTFSLTSWYRNIRTETVNGNLNNNSLDQSVYQPSATDIAALTAAGYTAFPASGANATNTPFPYWRCIAQGLEKSQPLSRCDAVIVYGKALQQDYGISGQVSWIRGRSQFIAGVAAGRGVVDFTQNTQFGYVKPDRGIVGIASWEDGSTNSGGAPVDTRVDLHGVTPNWSLYATDSLSLGRKWHLMLSGRYNRSTIDNLDQLNPVPGPGTLNGHDVYGRFNGSAGFTYSPVDSVNVYASYAESSRAPTSVELGCADPADPCTLPNSITSDPPLQQVVTGTWELGVRGKPEAGIKWSLGAFRAENRNDILFISAPATGAGYFLNVGKTRRQGIQASVDGHRGRVTGAVNYTLLNATFQSTETVDGSSNNSSDTALAGTPGLDGSITVQPGDTIPLSPRHTGKFFMDVQATRKLLFDLNVRATSSSYARGNENNQYKADGKYYMGPGVSPGYAVANAGAHYKLTQRLSLAAEIDNLFDRHYVTAAQLAPTGFTAQGTFIARPFPAYTTGVQAGNFPIQHATFFAPGAPRRFLIELRVKF